MSSYNFESSARLVYTTPILRMRSVSSSSAKRHLAGHTCGPVLTHMLQWWQKDEGVIQNGIYLGQIAAIVFKGPYEYAKVWLDQCFLFITIPYSSWQSEILQKTVAAFLDQWESPSFLFNQFLKEQSNEGNSHSTYLQNKLSFDFSQIKLRLGPKWFTYDVKTMKK